MDAYIVDDHDASVLGLMGHYEPSHQSLYAKSSEKKFMKCLSPAKGAELMLMTIGAYFELQ